MSNSPLVLQSSWQSFVGGHHLSVDEPPHLIRRAQTYKSSNEGRGSRTRRWRVDAPQRGTPRKLLKSKCGDKCFLKPETLAFPVCPKLGIGRDCNIDCRGVASAKVRAHQWKHPELYDKIEQLERECK